MLMIVLALFFGTFSGTAAGVLVSWWLLTDTNAERRPLDRPTLDPDLDARIYQAASGWAADQGYPEAAPLVGDKLRLFQALNQRRARRHGGEWSQWGS